MVRELDSRDFCHTMYIHLDGKRPMAATARLNFRVTEPQKTLIHAGAEAKGVGTSEFVLNSACKEAEQVLANRQQFTIPPERYNAFLQALDQPAQDKPRLRHLLSAPSVLEE